MNGKDLIDYADLCGWVSARAHARSGDPTALAGYLGKSPEFDEVSFGDLGFAVSFDQFLDGATEQGFAAECHA
jgi:Uncharacterized protein conserved in bacteria (DUF2252)